MYVLESPDMRRLAKELERSTKAGFKYGVRESLNRVAFAARKEWQSQMGRTFVLRNRWTVGSIRVERVKGLSLQTMQSKVGSVADYVKTQEDGGTVQGGARGYRRPTARAKSGRKPVKPRFRMKRLQLIDPDVSGAGGRDQKLRAASRIARERNAKFVFLDFAKDVQGMYQVMGSKRRPKLRLVWSMKTKSVDIPKHATMAPMLARMDRRFPRFAKAAFLQQCKRHRLLGFR